MSNGLTVVDITKIRDQAKEKLGLCRKSQDIIGTQIFAILGLYARVIYYPLGEDAPWGLTRISGSKNDALLEKPFVALNSSIPVDCQVFAAAHELYHIWFEQNPDILPADLLDERNKELNEKKANRFAAEFLVDDILLRQEIELHKIKEFCVKDVLKLADLFTVPYRTMAKRLHEIDVIDDMKRRELLEEKEDSIAQLKRRFSIPSPNPDNRIVMDNLVELAVAAYEQKYITFEKLEYLLRLGDLKPEDLGIESNNSGDDDTFPSDEELDSIMEE